MSGKRSRSKGLRNEREIVNLLKMEGVPAKRVPLSGGQEGYPGDIIIEGKDRDYIAEAKCRKDGFKQIYDWIAENDFLFIKQDRADQLVVMDINLLIRLLK